MEQPIQQHNSRNINNNSSRSNSRLMVVCQNEGERITFVGKVRKNVLKFAAKPSWEH